MATPFVTATAAMMKAIDSGLSPATIKQWIGETATFTRDMVGDFHRDGLFMPSAVEAAHGTTYMSPDEDDRIVPVHTVVRPAITGFEFVTEGQGPVDERLNGISVRNIIDGTDPRSSSQVERIYGLEGGQSFHGRVDRRPLPPGTTFAAVTVKGDGVSSAGTAIPPVGSSVPVVTGFKISSTLHELKEFAVRIAPGNGSADGSVEVTWTDDTPSDDTFVAVVDYALVPSNLIASKHVLVYDGYHGGFSTYIDGVNPVLQHFSLRFDGQNRKMRYIGVVVEPGEVSWTFGDSVLGDAVDVEIGWAELL